jgi:spore maturation protein CgeB
MIIGENHQIKVLFSSYRNPSFITITEYIEKAFKEQGCQTIFFNNRSFIIPGRIRKKISYFDKVDLRRINRGLIATITSSKPDLFVEAGGYRIWPETIDRIKDFGVKTILWTIDPPRNFDSIIKAAPHYDFVFTGGSEAYDILKGIGAKNLSFLPFACDPDFHNPQRLTVEEKRLYDCDIAFVGSVHPELYPFRVRILEAISDFDLGVWGPGAESISSSSPLKKRIRGDKTTPNVWTKIYSQAKIVLCMHYKDPEGKIPCHQASPRVYETMASGAFLMVDAQRDVINLFNPGVELVVFEDIEDLYDKIHYYLKHQNEREAIAHKGRETVLNKHTYPHRLEKMLSIVTG